MKIKEALAFNPRVILICGGESSGKTELLKQIAHTYAEDASTAVFSNHKDIYTTAPNKENIIFYYKFKDTQVVPSSALIEADVYLIDENCSNKDSLALSNPNKKFVFVESISEPITDSLIHNERYSFVDCFLIPNKDVMGRVSIEQMFIKEPTT